MAVHNRTQHIHTVYKTALSISLLNLPFSSFLSLFMYTIIYRLCPLSYTISQMPHYTSNLTINMTSEIDLVGGIEEEEEKEE